MMINEEVEELWETIKFEVGGLEAIMERELTENFL